MENAVELKDQGNELFRRGDVASARSKYEEGLRLDPSNPTLWSNVSQCLIKTKNYEEAFQAAERCVQINPAWAKGWYRKGLYPTEKILQRIRMKYFKTKIAKSST